MKRLVPACILLICMFCSCTKTIYTHQQVLQNCHTKDDVLKQFGKADKVDTVGEVEEWVYNRDKGAPSEKSKKQDEIKAQPDTVSRDTSQIAGQIGYTKYVKFIFDMQGNVVGYKAEGVDLTKKGKESFGKSVLNVAAATVIITALVAIDIYVKGDFDY